MKVDFENLSSKIKALLYDYMKIETFTGTANERLVEDFFVKHFENIPYFKEHPDYWGLYKIEGDVFDRSVCWAMVKGSENPENAVVLIHHYDVVGIEDFKTLKDYAFSPDLLAEELLKNQEMLNQEAREDLLSGDYIFGKGGCDMKAGGSIQYSLLEEYSKTLDLPGTVIVISVPDEENLSAGMRGAAVLLSELKKAHGFNYKLMINSEPHQRKNPEKGIYSLGSVGKLLPFVYVRGYMSHAGKAFEGLNPDNIMAEVIRRTELNMDLSDAFGNECSPPPTWLNVKDSKALYDVSMPLSAFGCLSVLTLTSTPSEILEKIKTICEESFDKIIKEMNASYLEFRRRRGEKEESLPWEVCVNTFSDLMKEAEDSCGNSFDELYQSKFNEVKEKFHSGEYSIIDSNFKLVEFLLELVEDTRPRIIYGLVPPYYPCTSNIEYEKNDEKIKNLTDVLNEFTFKEFNQIYDREYFFTGISDLSYVSMSDPETVRHSIEKSMPLFGELYDIPFEEIHDISMPMINIGPWGKDFHKLTERVLKEDTLVRTPRILNHAIEFILDQPKK